MKSSGRVGATFLIVLASSATAACSNEGDAAPRSAGAAGRSGTGAGSGAAGAAGGPQTGSAGVGGASGLAGTSGAAAAGGMAGTSGIGGASGMSGTTAMAGTSGIGGSAGASSSWVPLGGFPFTAGVTADITLPALEPGGAMAIHANAGADHCLQLVSWRVAGGADLLAQVGYGPFCADCEERTQVAVGAAVFVLPTAASPRAGASVLRVGLRDCPTFGSANESSGVSVALAVRGLSAVPTVGTLRLRPVRLGGSPFASSASAFAPLMTAMAAMFAGTGLELTSEPPCDATTVSGDLAFAAGDHAPLGAAESASHVACPRLPGTVPVLFAGCLRETSPSGDTTELDGYTPHLVGGADDAVADAVFVKGTLCGTPTPVPVAWSPPAAARIVAHELGHYLGLFHSIEADGTIDLLPDTGSDNLMYWRPATVATPAFSALQGAVMRRHPSVL